ncbi:carbohydrate ABC transporter permease [Streptomyces luteogriseus]|uniref:carbohydrate ABC transporter permease n=1 Tax=Streptomyces luteogriseus TaxID=68233 RepID=UPI0037ABD9D7
MIHRRPVIALGFLLPAIALYAFITLYPTVRGAWLSFTDSLGGEPGPFVGLANYEQILNDSQATAALKNTLVYAAFVVVCQNLLGLIFAIWLMSLPRILGAIRVALLAPAMMAPVLAGFIWSYIYAPGGSLDAVLSSLGMGKQTWLAEPSHALYAVAAVHVWMFTGYSCAIFLASYLAIPQDLKDAALLDGASAWQRFRCVDWPLLAPATTITVTLSVIGTLRTFDLPLVMTNGGPVNSTETLSLLIYQKVFQESDFAYGTALAVVLLLVVIILSSATSTLLQRRERHL